MTRTLVIVCVLAALVGGLVGATVVARGQGETLDPATLAANRKAFQEMLNQEAARDQTTTPVRSPIREPRWEDPSAEWRRVREALEAERRLRDLEDQAEAARRLEQTRRYCGKGGAWSIPCP